VAEQVAVQVDRWRQVVSWAAGLFICKHGKTKNGISERIARGWINDLDITKTFIEIETDGQRGSDGYPNVIKIRCKVCSEFRTKLKNVRNLSTAFIDET